MKCPKCKNKLNSECEYKLKEYNRCICQNCGVKIIDEPIF